MSVSRLSQYTEKVNRLSRQVATDGRTDGLTEILQPSRDHLTLRIAHAHTAIRPEPTCGVCGHVGPTVRPDATGTPMCGTCWLINDGGAA